MRKGFTLAEVLITLGIIGIVAAMTLPTLINNYKKQEVSSKIKKFYTTMSQAVKLSEVDNGPVIYWSKDARKENEDGSITNISGTLAFYNTYLAKYLKKMPSSTDADRANVVLADGSTISMNIGYCLDIVYDYNGKKNPNVMGVDKFDFLLCTEEGYNAGFIRNKQNLFDAYFPGGCVKNKCSRENLMDACKQNAAFCSALIMNDGWEFKDDYPYKLQ